MILVDTSVWLDYFNGTTNTHTEILDSALAEGVVVMGDLILLEILQGFRNNKDYQQAKDALLTLDQHALFGQHLVVKCADNYRALRKKGITVRKTNDVIIATYCIENGIPLLFTDKDFLPFTQHLNLKPAYHES